MDVESLNNLNKLSNSFDFIYCFTYTCEFDKGLRRRERHAQPSLLESKRFPASMIPDRSMSRTTLLLLRTVEHSYSNI